MDRIKPDTITPHAITPKRLAATALAVLCLWQTSAYANGPCGDLHAQSAQAVLARDFSSPGLSFLLLNERGEVIAHRWPSPERETPVGSLIKPFLAVAYGRTHDSFPVFHCSGMRTCWLPRGHGTLGIAQAIAVSCNSYFHQLLSNAGPEFAKPTLETFGLKTNDNAGNDQVDLFEQGRGWKAPPLQLARAYLDLTNHSREDAVAPVLRGMAMSARKGTASALASELRNWPMLAKTGTAPCIHRVRAPGDGLAAVLAPADHPNLVLLVRVHGKPGSAAAAVAGRMIAAIEKSGPRQ
ncbi:MAG TPA: penicillin-binding transpeptidase domain-containing protein [Verrucomicrobiae bacterium]|nr:penicillin-binding transpeptidase domain-containing protein [Verrucomicrobiae bacterium]